MKFLKKLKILYSVNKLYGKIKEGIKMKKLLEREFLLSIAGIAASIWAAVSGLIPAELAAKITAGVVMVFTIARAIAKMTPTTKDDEIIARIEALFRAKK